MGKVIGKANQRTGPAAPATVPALLRTLGMNDKTVVAQKAALRGWLDEHLPSKALRLSLRSNGYGILLSEVGAERRPIPPITAIHKLGA